MKNVIMSSIVYLLFTALMGFCYFAGSSPSANLSSQFAQAPVSSAPQLASTVNQAAVVCGNPCSCSPAAGTIHRGVQVTVIETTSCSGETWYKIGDGQWLAPGLIDNSTPDTATRLPTPTDRPPTPTPEPVIITGDCVGGCVEYPSWCAPPIKGNVSYETGERIYHVPGQEYYDETKIRPDYDERWFCTEQEARAAGWRKSRR